MGRKKVKGIKQGKFRIVVNGQMINTQVYMDYEGRFIMVKGKRIKVNWDPAESRFYTPIICSRSDVDPEYRKRMNDLQQRLFKHA